MNIDKIKKIMYLLICLLIVIIIIKYSNLLYLIGCLFKLLMPILIGFIYCWFFNPLINKLWFSRRVNAIIVFLSVIVSIVLFGYFIVPSLYREIKDLVILIPDIINYINNIFVKFNIDSYINISSFNIDEVPMIILKNIKILISFFSTVIIGLMVGLYMSFDYEYIYSYFMSRCNNREMVRELSRSVRCSIKGTLIVAFLVFVLSFIFFSLIKLDGALLLGFVCGLTDLIPYIGPYIGGAIAVIFAISEGGKLWFYTLLGCVFIQILENNIFQPCIISKTTKLDPLLVIIGMIIFGKLFGLLGMIVATPLVCIIKILYKYTLQNKINHI